MTKTATIENVVSTADNAANIKINSITRSLTLRLIFFAKRGLIVVLFCCVVIVKFWP